MRRPSVLSLLLALCLLAGGALFALAQDDNPQGFSGTVSYTVEAQDTLDSIGARYDVAVACLAELNDLDNPARIFPGDVLTISDECPTYEGYDVVLNPRSEAASASGQGGDDRPQPAPGDQTYVIEQGDTFDGIAQEFNVSVISLLLANGNPSPSEVFVGDVIIIPAGAPPYGAFPALDNPFGGDDDGQGGGLPAPGPGEEVYVVQRGDILDLLAAAYDIDLACLAERNDLELPNYIFPGLAILIPANCGPYTGLSTAPTLNPLGVGGGQIRQPSQQQEAIPTQESFGQGGGQNPSSEQNPTPLPTATPTTTLPALVQPTPRGTAQAPASTTDEAVG